MKIQLKNLKVNLAFSEETTMFHADVYVNGQKTAYAKNDGRGGCTDYHAYQGMHSLLNEAERYAQSLPSTFHEYGGKKFEIKSNLEWMIDTLVNDHIRLKERAKAEKKILKLTLNNIVWGVPNGNSYKMIGFTGKPMFEDMKKTPIGIMSLQKLQERVKGELKEGEIIFNKNL